MPEGLVELIKLLVRARYAFAAWVMCLVAILLARSGMAEATDAVKKFGIYLYALGGFFFIVWLVEIGIVVWDKLSEKLAERKKKKDLLDMLPSLNPQEMFLLARGVFLGYGTFEWGKMDPAIASLEAKQLIKTTDNPNWGFGRIVMIPKPVWDYLVTHKVDFIERAKTMNPDKVKNLEPKVDQHTTESPQG